jgi:hypothetical protein
MPDLYRADVSSGYGYKVENDSCTQKPIAKPATTAVFLYAHGAFFGRIHFSLLGIEIAGQTIVHNL